MVASQSETLESLLGAPAASLQALDYYRIPLFLLPIYQSAAVQYGVPWQILAAINEIETDYGNDLNVSSAGAVGWMQFMPSTWLQYGVDVQDAGYADPYNPVDAIFAAGRYLRAAGAANNLKRAIFAYNHSQEYVESVMLRAKLISSYPSGVIAALTGLAEGRLPIAGALAIGESTIPWPHGGVTAAVRAARGLSEGAGEELHLRGRPGLEGAGNASTAGLSGSGDSVGGGGGGHSGGESSLPPAPQAAGDGATSRVGRLRLVNLSARAGRPVVAVQDGKVIAIGRSHRLGRYLVLKDVFGDLYTYAGLGGVSRTYHPARASSREALPEAVLAGADSSEDSAPTAAASAGRQPLTIKVSPKQEGGHGEQSTNMSPAQSWAAGDAGVEGSRGKVRVFARPENPYARAAAARARSRDARASGAEPLRPGSVVSAGTVLGQPTADEGSGRERLEFAISPAGDAGTVDAQPIMQSWRQLHAALDPKGAKREAGLLGATAGDAFLLSRAALASAVLSDPGVGLGRCAHRDVSIGAVGRKPLAVLAFLSRSGLMPTVGPMPCLRRVRGGYSAVGVGVQGPAQSVEITKVNGITIAGHQGSGSIADLTIRTLLTLQGTDMPSTIDSLMHYPGSPSTVSARRWAEAIKVSFAPSGTGSATARGTRRGARTATAGAGLGVGGVRGGSMMDEAAIGSGSWRALVGRIGALPQPSVSRKESPAAVQDPGPDRMLGDTEKAGQGSR